MFASVTKDACGTDGDSRLCNSHGKCEDDSSSIHGYVCACRATWAGVSCGSPVPFNMPQLQAAASRVELLCSACEHTVSLRPGEIALFRVEQPVQVSRGVAIEAKALAGPAAGDPDLYVSKELPRTVYDFTRISAADGPAEVMELREKYSTGVYWLAVLARSAHNASSSGGAGSSSLNTRRLGAVSPSDGGKAVSYRVRTSLLTLDVVVQGSVTDKKFTSELSNWLTSSTNGVATLVVCLVILVCMCGGCLCRMCCSQDNKDTLREDLDKKLKRATERKEAAASIQHMTHIPNPVQSATDTGPGPSMAQRFGLPQAQAQAPASGPSSLRFVSPQQADVLHSGVLHKSAPPAQPAAAAQQRAPMRRAVDEI